MESPVRDRSGPRILERRIGRRAGRRRAGLTLSETLVVIAIVATLTGLSLSGVQRLRATSDRTKCANNLRQIVLAAQQYHTDRGRLPSGSFTLYEHVSWRGPLLPYLEQGALWQTARDQLGAEMYFGDPKFLAGHTVVSAFICPSDSAAQAVKSAGIFHLSRAITSATPVSHGTTRRLRKASRRVSYSRNPGSLFRIFRMGLPILYWPANDL